MPPKPPTIGGWMDFGIAQTAQLDKANQRTKDAVGIISRCEARDKAVSDSLAPKPWWHVW
jgi:hypothetical protein